MSSRAGNRLSNVPVSIAMIFALLISAVASAAPEVPAVANGINGIVADSKRA